MKTVLLNGDEVDFDTCVNLMDDDIREKIHNEGIENEQDFLDIYLKYHLKKYGKDFCI